MKILSFIKSLQVRNSKEELLENKIFSIITLAGALTCFLSIIVYSNVGSYVNVNIGFSLMDLILLIAGIIFSVFFYLSFFRGIIRPLILPFQIIVVITLTVGWFYAQGINGSMPLFFFPAMFLLIYSNIRKKYWYIYTSFILLGIMLLAIEYFYPEWIVPYPDEIIRLADISVSFFISLSIFGYLAVALKKNFDNERSKVHLKNKELKASEARLHELNATKDKFFSIISHDLKSPFNSIIGFSELLMEHVQERDLKKIDKYSEIIHESSQRAMDLLVNLLEWSRTQTGSLEFTPEIIDLVELTNEVVKLFSGSARLKSITILKEIPPNTTLFAGKSMISTVLRNLISNAVKFTFPGGQIVIAAEQTFNGLKISVSDNGAGIKADAIEKLFKIDGNHSTPGTQNEGGTGLGLLLCKEFISKHGGEIRVSSEKGKGSIFYFTIPNN